MRANRGEVMVTRNALPDRLRPSRDPRCHAAVELTVGVLLAPAVVAFDLALHLGLQWAIHRAFNCAGHEDWFRRFDVLIEGVVILPVTFGLLASAGRFRRDRGDSASPSL